LAGGGLGALALGGLVGGPVGAGIGAFAGTALAGLFGGKKPSVGPNAYAESLIGPGGWSLWETGADNGGQAAPLADLSEQIAKGFAELVAGLGGTIGAGQQTNFHLGNFPSQGGIWAAVGGTAGRRTFGDDSEAAVRFIFAELLDKLSIEGLGAEFEAAASKAIRLADSTEQMASDLEFLQAYFADGLLSEETKTAGEQFMDALADAFDEATTTATRLGLSLDRIETMRDEAVADFIEGFNTAQADAIGAIEDPLGQAMTAFERYAEDLRAQAEYLEQFGADVTLIERRIALERQRVIEQFGNDATDRLRDALLRLETGGNSALSPGAQLEIARQAFEQTAALALSGDATAQGGIAGVIDTFLGASRAFNAETLAFAQDFEAARSVLRALTGDTAAAAGAAAALGAGGLGSTAAGGEDLSRLLSASNDNSSAMRSIAMETLGLMVDQRDYARRIADSNDGILAEVRGLRQEMAALARRTAA
jgi:hypothetical protein